MLRAIPWFVSLCVVLVAGDALGRDKPATAKQAASHLAKVARFYYQQSNYGKAAGRFHDAFKLDKRPEYLFNAARAAQRGAALAEAARDFKACLRLKSNNGVMRRRAQQHLREIERARASLAKFLPPDDAKETPPAGAPAKRYPNEVSGVSSVVASDVENRNSLWPIIGWSGVAVGAIGAGVASWALTRPTSDSVEAAPLSGGAANISRSPRRVGGEPDTGTVDASKPTNPWLVAGLITGGVAVAAGLTIALWPRDTQSDVELVALPTGPSSAGFALQF